MNKDITPGERFMLAAAQISMEWIDITPFARALESEYQRGRREATDEMMARISGLREKGPVGEAEARVAPKNMIERQPRPLGLPPNFEMARVAIQELGGKATGAQIREFVRKRFWPSIPEQWSSGLYAFVETGKLERIGLDFALASVEEPKPETHTHPPDPPSARSPPPPQTMEARNELATAEFEHGTRSVRLNATQYRIAVKLKAAMGKGFLDFKFLSQAGLLRIHPNAESWCREMVDETNPLLAQVGVFIKFTPKFGCEMKEIL